MKYIAGFAAGSLLWGFLFGTASAVGPKIELSSLKSRATSKTVHLPLHIFSALGYPEQEIYYVNVTLGTPKVTGAMAVMFTWGDLWVFNYNCSKTSTCDRTFGNFNRSLGETYPNATFATETISVEGINSTFSNFQFVFTEPMESDFDFGNKVEVDGSLIVVKYSGFLGLGLPVNQGLFTTQYPSLGQTLVNTGAINSYSFSLWHDDLKAKTGNVLFGGIDPTAYSGNLSTFTWSVRAFSVYDGFQPMIIIQGITITTKTSSRSFTNSSGVQISATFAEATYLAPNIVRPLWDYLGVNYRENASEGPDNPIIQCSQRSNTTASFRFDLGSGVIFDVPVWEMIAVTPSEEKPNGLEGNWCPFFVHEARDTTPMSLGQNMVKRLYAVYDYPNGQVSFALNSFMSKKTSFLEIPVGGVRAISTTPSVPPVAETSKPSTPGGNESSPPSKALPIGLGVGIPVVLVLVGILIFLYRRHTNRKREEGKGSFSTKVELSNGNEIFRNGELGVDTLYGGELDAGHGISEVETGRKINGVAARHELQS